MATIFSDDFNSYDDGDLNTQGGWSGSTTFDIQGTTVKEGAKALKAAADSGNNIYIEKTGSQVADGKITVYIRSNDIGSETDFQLFEGDTLKIEMDLGNDGNIRRNVGGGVGWTAIQAWTADTWYCFEIEWRSSDKKARYRVDGGSWIDWEAPYRNFSSYIDRVRVRYYALNAGYEGYFDYIAEEPYVPPQDVTVTPSEQILTTSIQDPIITAQQQITISANVQLLTATLQKMTIISRVVYPYSTQKNIYTKKTGVYSKKRNIYSKP